MAVYDEGYAPTGAGPRLSNVVNMAGAALSLALILGVGFWGYKLIVRDVSGIPVVRAMEGEMRVLPENPGGEVAPHTGLSVNEVAASGEAGGPEDRLVLAPRTPGLAQEDLEVGLAPAEAAPMEDPAPVALNAATDIDQLAAQLASLAETTLAPMPETVQAEPAVAILPASTPGVAVSIRPMLRPAALRIQPAAAPASSTATEPAVTTASFTPGTNLVQLGAFPTPTLAAQEWDRLQGRFGELMAGRSHFIEVSNQSAGTWYRLRASGFADRAEARRLCAALEAEGADCIAVVVD